MVPIAIYLGWSMTARINIGVRHVLPIYPFLIVLAAVAIDRLIVSGRRYIVAAAVGLCMLEAGTAYPHTLAFFNVLAGGPSGGIPRIWRIRISTRAGPQGAEIWMDEHRVDSISLGYWGHADPQDDGIKCTYLPGAPGWIDDALLQRPRLPGYVAVSATLLQGVYAENEGQRNYYRRLLSHTPAAIIGHSILCDTISTANGSGGLWLLAAAWRGSRLPCQPSRPLPCPPKRCRLFARHR